MASGWCVMPIAWAAAIGAVGSIVAGSEQAGAQNKAANTQAGMFNTIVGQEQPFLQAGYGATSDLNQLLGTAPATGKGGTAGNTGLPEGYLTETFNPTMADLQKYPGYQFALQQGGQALTNSMTPGVGAVSGPALKSLMSFNQGLASQTYQAGFNNFQTQQTNIFNRLNAIAGLGQNAAGNLGNAGTQLGTGIAQAQAAAGGSIAGGIAGAANSAGSGLALNYLMNNGGGGFTPNNAAGYGGSTSGWLTSSDLNNMSAGMGTPAIDYSDYGLKTAIEPYRFNGTSHLMVYDFEFKTEPGKRHRGYIAQEVQARYPEAILVGPLGFLKVDYSKIPGWDELDAISRESLDG